MDTKNRHLVCPNCKTHENLGTIESLQGVAGATFYVEDQEVVHNGYTEVAWDTSTSIGIQCTYCGWSFEDTEDEEAIDKLEPEPFECANCGDEVKEREGVGWVHVKNDEVRCEPDDAEYIAEPREFEA